MSVYLFSSEGMSSRNSVIMDYVILLTKTAKCPFVIGGDFNVSPACMDETGLPQQMGGTIVAPCEDSYVAAGFSSLVDFFIIHHGMAAQTTVCRVDQLAPIAKHSPVRISIRSDLKHVLSRQITKPVAYPKAAPICCRQVPVVDHELMKSVVFSEVLRSFAFADPPRNVCPACRSPGRRDVFPGAQLGHGGQREEP